MDVGLSTQRPTTTDGPRRSAPEREHRHRGPARPGRTFSGPVVERRRLVSALARAVDEAVVTLVCAPAGSGKTVLVSCWADGARDPVGWLTVTSRDDDPHVFWRHVRSALSDAGALSARPRSELVLGGDDVDLLACRLPRTGSPVVLVLDAVERIGRQEIFDGLAALVDRTHGLLRLVLATREDPPLPLHRYRLDGTLAELSPTELALTPAELHALLEAYGVRLPAGSVATLVDRTEGWVAGARMAALALRPGATGTTLERSASDYLAVEVLAPLPEAERDLLLRVSILDEVSPGSRRP
ncbi:hypothetical protein [Cellulosimicrobium sp. CUA-896]|uniref:hypothetical protein n=1 Tax=Cellulosimicrobium sp. CUA-896 TaxID=1517881 RepID=UPI00095E7314|nr:hypothetical protein [Cellulosimicrobium sp. CUA-896]OLT53086.1 hypothetical protein BJF88_01630 [Cellulosimicrobium sp. CUA-896]